MKLHPPKPIINPAEPYKDALFNRQALGESLTQLLRNLIDPVVIMVHAPWGEGKSTFSKMWETDLNRQNLKAIYFDAYRADYFGDPFVCFSGEILAFAKEHFSEAENERSELKRTAIGVAKSLAGLATKTLVKAATNGAVGEQEAEEFKKIVHGVTDGLADIAAATVEKRIENYAAEKDTLEAFRKTLEKLAAAVRTQQGFPLTIIVDELDRCRPSFALALLERIKHLFDVPGVAFVLLVNKTQIESYIQTVYGNVDAHAYLLKFANIFIDLPHQGEQYVNGRGAYCQKLFAHHELSRYTSDGRFLANCLYDLAEHFSLTLREIEKVFVVLGIYYSTFPPDASETPFVPAVLSILKVHQPSTYAQLRSCSMSHATFLSETRFDQLLSRTYSMDPDWARARLASLLMTEKELDAALPTEGPRAGWQQKLANLRLHLPSNRLRIIPQVCAALDRFSINLTAT